MEILIPEAISQVIELLETAGYEAWLVGGSVRDSLLGKSPKDWDVTTSADIAAIQEILAGSVRFIPVGARFGTISLIVPGLKAEVSTFRGRNLALDLARRDFTINALAWHPQRGLEDPHGGQEDLEEGIIRCPGRAEDIFTADPLRMMRAARFSAQLGFSVDAMTLAAIKKLHYLIDEVSSERVRDELSAILISPRPLSGMDFLQETGLLDCILPELQACVGFGQHNPHHHLDVYRHIMAVVENTPPNLVLRLAAMFHDIGKPLCLSVDEKGIGHFYGHDREGAALTGQIMRRLRYDNATVSTVKNLVRQHMLSINYPSMNPAKLLARVGRENVDNLFILQEADARAGVDSSVERIDKMRNRVEAALADNRPFTRRDLKISGKDLLEIGFPAGVAMGKALDMLLAAVIKNPQLNEKKKLMEIAKLMLTD